MIKKKGRERKKERQRRRKEKKGEKKLKKGVKVLKGEKYLKFVSLFMNIYHVWGW